MISIAKFDHCGTTILRNAVKPIQINIIVVLFIIAFAIQMILVTAILSLTASTECSAGYNDHFVVVVLLVVLLLLPRLVQFDGRPAGRWRKFSVFVLRNRGRQPLRNHATLPTQNNHET
jgi:hypothetical protein